MTMPQTNEEPDWDFLDYAFHLEEEWRKSLPRYTYKIFPQAKAVIPEKLAEFEEKRDRLSNAIKKKLIFIKQNTADEFARWFWRACIKITDGVDLLTAERHIGRLKRLLMIAEGKKPKGRLTEGQIQRARAVPIETLINQPLRKSGKTLVGLCPLHNENSPSFHVYPATNSFYCFGCGEGGDVIKFMMLLHDCPFREAVMYLVGN